jgi:hypothetical protein
MVAGKGLKDESVTTKPKELDFVLSRKLTREEILAAIGVRLVILGSRPATSAGALRADPGLLLRDDPPAPRQDARLRQRVPGGGALRHERPAAGARDRTHPKASAHPDAACRGA